MKASNDMNKEMYQPEESFVPILKGAVTIDQEKQAAYDQRLRVFFLDGKKQEKVASTDIYPLWQARALAEREKEKETEPASEEQLDLTGRKALQILSQQLLVYLEAHTLFLNRLKKTITGLEGLIRLEGGGADPGIGELDFAADLISFDKIRSIAIDTVSSHLPASRLKRLKWALKILSEAKQRYTGGNIALFCTEQFADTLDLAQVIDARWIKKVPDQLCQQAQRQSSSAVKSFVQTMSALKMGELMVEQNYEEDVHDAYFDTYDRKHLSDEDLKYLPLTIVLEESKNLLQRSSSFLRLLSNNSFIKVLALNWLDDLYVLADQEEADYLELASLVIFRRNSFVYQADLEQPDHFSAAIQKGLDFPGAVFWNVLAVEDTEEESQSRLPEIRAAIASRYFPKLEYYARGNHFDFHQLKLDGNPSPEDGLAPIEQLIREGDKTTIRSFSLNPAAFLAMRAEARGQLMLLPSDYQTERLLPLAEYLGLSSQETSGRIPFIWMVDKENVLQRAAIPLHWLQKSRSRFEYWGFLQSMAGMNQAHRQATLAEARIKWEEEKNTALESQKSLLKEQFETEKNSLLQEGITKMLYGFIYEDKGEEVLREVPPVPATQVVSGKPEELGDQQSPVKAQAQTKATEPELAAPASPEAWVESDECTSCKDCIVALPGVFKYNEDKQAYVHDPRGGSFAEIVKAAEKCPSRCIHPGTPLDKKEPALDKWIKRAEKFN